MSLSFTQTLPLICVQGIKDTGEIGYKRRPSLECLSIAYFAKNFVLFPEKISSVNILVRRVAEKLCLNMMSPSSSSLSLASLSVLPEAACLSNFPPSVYVQV